MKSITLLFAVSFILITNALLAISPVKVQQFIHHKDWSFVENKGQLANQSEIKYYGHQGGVYLYCKPGMLSFVFTKVENDEKISEATGTSEAGLGLSPDGGGFLAGAKKGIGWKNQKETPQPSKISTSRTDLVLLASNPNAQIIATDLQEYYENYYTTGDADHGITNVQTFKTVTYKSIYPDIDMVLNCRKQGLEYSFVVHPGGKVSDIQLRWNGTGDAKALANGGFTFSNSLGSINESAPESFVEKKKIQSSLLKKSGVYSFEISGYDKTKDLLIDPILIWATYFGGTAYDAVSDIAIDASGNLSIVGYTASSTGIATSGAYQTSYNGGTYDAFVGKFNAVGVEQWASYYGSSGYLIANGIVIDGSDDIYISGSTTGTSGIATSGSYQSSYGGGYGDVFLAKFSSGGALVWATYFGGSDLDNGYALSIDGSGNVYIGGGTSSTSGIVTSGAYQTSFGGNSDAFLAKFSSSGNLTWATYYGSDNEVYGIKSDASGNLYITGSTTSSNGLASSGAYQTSNAGDKDVFIAKFSSSGTRYWGTYFGGTVEDVPAALAIDGSGNLYIAGYTSSSDGIATSGAYQTSYSGNNTTYTLDGFLSKFSSSGGILWSTYYGGSGSDNVSGISTDGQNNIYITGSTTSTSGIATSGAYQTSYGGGNNDAFLAKFSSAGSISWSSYYGGSGFDGATRVRNDIYDNVYMCGSLGSSGMATSGAYQTSYEGSNDGFIVKFNSGYQNEAGIVSINSASGTLCAGKQSVKAILENYGSSNLTADSIYWKVNGTVQTPIKWTGSLKTDSTMIVTLGTCYFSSGNDTIVAWSAKPNGIKDSVPGDDTAKANFKVNTLPAASVISNTAICSDAAISIGASAVTGSAYSWISSVSGFSSTISNPSVSPTSTATYTITETNTKGCSNSNSVTITVNRLPAASVISNTAICFGTTISIGASAVTGSSYSWASSVSGFSSTLSNPSVSPTSTSSYTLTETNSNGCSNSNSDTITVNILPAAAVISNTAICSGSAISIGASAVTGSIYSWVGASGYSSTISNPSVSPASTETYTLTETKLNGCSKSDSVIVTVNSLPVVSVISDKTICMGTSISIGTTTVSGINYSWVSNPSGFISKVSNPTVKPTDTTTYYLTETNSATGCSSSNSVTIAVNPTPKSIFSFTNVCPGDSSPFNNSSTLATSYDWYFGDGGTSSLASPKHMYSSIGNYTVSLKVTSSRGCTDSVSKKLSISNCVWPGDANDDKVVDMNDLLAIGVAYGTVGHPRPNASISWAAQPSPDWDSSFSTGVNYKNADCNGDSIVNYKDTLAVSANYGLSHSKSSGINQGSPSDPTFIIKYAKDTFYAGDTLVAQVVLGNSIKPVNNLYGIAFSLTVDPAVFDVNKAQLKIPASFLGTNGTDLIFMNKNNTGPGTMDIGISRITHLNTSGHGTIVALYLPVNSTLPSKYLKTSLSLSNNYQISYNQKPVSLYLTSDSVLIKQDHTGIENPKTSEPISLSIFPNPFQATTTITYNLKHKSEINIVLIDMAGKQIGTIVNENQISGNYQFDINAEKYHLNPGIYFMKFMMNDEVVSRRLVKF